MKRIRVAVIVIPALTYALALAACGSSDGTAVANTPADARDHVLAADFRRCPYTAEVEFSAGGWSGSVSGDISCDQAGSLIQHHFNRDAAEQGAIRYSDADSIRTSDPARFTSNGYDCATFPLPDGVGWHALCVNPTAQISFYITP